MLKFLLSIFSISILLATASPAHLWHAQELDLYRRQDPLPTNMQESTTVALLMDQTTEILSMDAILPPTSAAEVETLELMPQMPISSEMISFVMDIPTDSAVQSVELPLTPTSMSFALTSSPVFSSKSLLEIPLTRSSVKSPFPSPAKASPPPKKPSRRKVIRIVKRPVYIRKPVRRQIKRKIVFRKPIFAKPPKSMSQSTSKSIKTSNLSSLPQPSSSYASSIGSPTFMVSSPPVVASATDIEEIETSFETTLLDIETETGEPFTYTLVPEFTTFIEIPEESESIPVESSDNETEELSTVIIESTLIEEETMYESESESEIIAITATIITTTPEPMLTSYEITTTSTNSESQSMITTTAFDVTTTGSGISNEGGVTSTPVLTNVETSRSDTLITTTPESGTTATVTSISASESVSAGVGFLVRRIREDVNLLEF